IAVITVAVGADASASVFEATPATVIPPDAVSDEVIPPVFPFTDSNTPTKSKVPAELAGQLMPVVGLRPVVPLVVTGVPKPRTIVPALLLTAEMPTFAQPAVAGVVTQVASAVPFTVPPLGPALTNTPVPLMMRIPAAFVGKVCVFVIG